MMTNRIYRLIREFPTVGEEVFELRYENKEMGCFSVSVSGCEDLILHITNIPKAVHNAKEWRARAIADHIYMAATSEHKPTLNDISKIINNILYTNVVFWDMDDLR